MSSIPSFIFIKLGYLFYFFISQQLRFINDNYYNDYKVFHSV